MAKLRKTRRIPRGPGPERAGKARQHAGPRKGLTGAAPPESTSADRQVRHLLAALRRTRLEDSAADTSAPLDDAGPPAWGPVSPDLLREIEAEFGAVVAVNRNLARELARFERDVEEQSYPIEIIPLDRGRPPPETSLDTLIQRALARARRVQGSPSSGAKEGARGRCVGHRRLPRPRRDVRRRRGFRLLISVAPSRHETT